MIRIINETILRLARVWVGLAIAQCIMLQVHLHGMKNDLELLILNMYSYEYYVPTVDSRLFVSENIFIQ